MEIEGELETLAVMVHGAGAAFDALGVAYNLRRRQWFDVGMSLIGCLFHCVAVYKHDKYRRKL